MKLEDLIQSYCLKEELSTFDPYDVWKTKIGLFVKNLFNESRLIGAAPALALTLIDLYVNNGFRVGYDKQEYPIVRSLAALTLLNLYEKEQNPIHLEYADKHLTWLVDHACKGYSGACWGLGFKWPAAPGVIYDENTPHSTHTPYALEAFHRFYCVTNDPKYNPQIKSAFRFYEKDLIIMNETEDSMAISYGPFEDRIVVNAAAYSLFIYSLFLYHLPEEREHITKKIGKLYRFITDNQRADGSWLYSPDDTKPFIDCFHSCFVIKNLIKANKNFGLANVDRAIESGYAYVLNNFFNEEKKLYKRFTVKNKLSLINYDLYDNAEVLNLAKMMGDATTVNFLQPHLIHTFVRSGAVYSSIDITHRLINKNHLRWATMPFLYALSK